VIRYALQNVERRYRGPAGEPVLALDGVTLTILSGERLALVGPSGSGKSTLLRLLNATLFPTAGRLVFEDWEVSSRDAKRLKAMRSRIGAVHQHLGLVPPLPAYENVLAGKLGTWPVWKALLARGIPPRHELERACALLAEVGLGDKWQAVTRSLSGGEQQRVAIARLLMQAPSTMLLDEPVSALDPGLSEEIIRRLVAVSSESGKTLVASMHDVVLARKYFPRLVGLRKGRLLFDLPSEDVSEDLLRQLYEGAEPKETAEALAGMIHGQG